jgi:hypothetical protein
MNQIDKGYGDDEVGQSNERVGYHMGPHQSRLGEVTIEMRQKI